MDNIHVADIPFTKKTNIDEYTDAFDVQNETIDFNKLDEYKNSEYVFDADKLHDIENVTNDMQLDWKHNIIDGLNDKTNLFNSWINNLSSNAKEWESGASNKYYKNDIVTYSEDPGAYFICLEDCDGTEPLYYIKFTNTQNNIDKFGCAFSINNEIVGNGICYVGTPSVARFPEYKLNFRYDGAYNLELYKDDTYYGDKIDYLIINGAKEIFNRINYTVRDSKWLRIYLKGDVGLNSFNLIYKGEWNNTVDVIDSLPSTIKLLDESIGTQFNYFHYSIVVHSGYPSTREKVGTTPFKLDIPTSEHKTLSDSQYGFSCDYYFDYDGSNYINVHNIINSGTSSTQKMRLRRITKGSITGERISYQYVYVPNDVVYIKNGTNIDFYVCISEVAYDDNAIRPDQDTTHWIKLFTKKLDGFVVLNSMPNQTWFDDDTNPSVFGVKRVEQSVYYYSASGEKYDSEIMRAKNNSVSFITQSPDEIKGVVVRCEFYRNNELYYSENYTINNLRRLYPPSTISAIRFLIDSDDIILTFTCNYDYDQHRITLKVDNVVGNVQTEYSFCAYIESIYTSDPLLKIVDRVHSESASNPQYLKLYTVANNVVDSNDNNLNTLINNLISNTNI